MAATDRATAEAKAAAAETKMVAALTERAAAEVATKKAATDMAAAEAVGAATAKKAAAADRVAAATDRAAAEAFRAASEAMMKNAELKIDDLQVAFALHGRARCWKTANNRKKEGELLRQALTIFEARLGHDDLSVAYTLCDLAECLDGDLTHAWGEEAAALFKRALKIFEAKSHDKIAVCKAWAGMVKALRGLRRFDEARALFWRFRQTDGLPTWFFFKA